MVIRCAGVQRFSISRREKLRHGLWIADVTQLEGDLPVDIPIDLQKASDALAKLIRSLSQPGSSANKMPLLPPYRLDDCGWVANRWCEILPISLGAKQKLMELAEFAGVPVITKPARRRQRNTARRASPAQPRRWSSARWSTSRNSSSTSSVKRTATMSRRRCLSR